MKHQLASALIIWLTCTFAQAIPPPPLAFKEDEVFNLDFSVFPVSTEMQIGKIQHLVQRAPKGVYLTVGSERSFRAVSMMPQATYLFQIDVAQPIVRFNLINKELLKTPKREAYLKLRYDASFKDWQAFMATSQQKGLKVHLTEDDFIWWRDNVRDIDSMSYKLPAYLNRYHTSPPCKDGKTPYEKNIDLATVLDYKTGNYLFYDDLYANLHRLASEGRILTMKVNLLDKSQVTQLAQYFTKHHLTLSVLDFDNLYYESYLGQGAYHKVIQDLTPLGQEESLLIVMTNYKDYACGQYQFYLGFSFGHVNDWDKHFLMQNFIDGLPEPIHDLIGGHLYEKGDKLPRLSKKK